MYYGTRLFYRVLEALFRYRWLFGISMAGVVAAALLTLVLKGHTYSGTASVQVVTQDTATAMGLLTGAAPVESPADQYMKRFRDRLGDDQPGGFLDRALHRAHLKRPINLNPAANDPRYALLRKRITVDSSSDTIFVIGLTWDEAAECERILDSLQKEFIASASETEQSKSLATEHFLDSEIASYESRLQKAEAALSQYKQNNPEGLPESQAATMDQLNALRTKLNDLKVTSQDSELKRQAILKRLGQIRPMTLKEQTFGLAPGEAGKDEDPASRQLRELEVQRSLLLLKYRQDHPEVKSLDAQIIVLKKSLPAPGAASETKLETNPEYRDLMEKLTQANIDQRTQQSQMGLLQQELAQYQQRLHQLPEQDRELTRKTRDYTVLKTQYESLLERREQARMKANLDEASALSTLIPVGSIYAEPPYGPRKMLLMIAGGAIFGIVLGILLVLFRDWLDPSLRYTSNIEDLLGEPLLAMVPESTAVKPFVGQSISTNGWKPDLISSTDRVDQVLSEAEAAALLDYDYHRPAAAAPQHNRTPNSNAHGSANGAGNNHGLPLLSTSDGETLVRVDPTRRQLSSGSAIEVYPEKTLPEFSHLYASLERRAPQMEASTLVDALTPGEHGSYVMGITSAIPGEGKTTVALNLAINAARMSSKKICLIDLGLGDDDLGHRLGVLSSRKGIISVLEATDRALSTLEIGDYLEDGNAGISGREAPLDTARLARSPRIGSLIAAARERFSVVLVDLPAVSTDNVGPLARHVDGLVFVTGAGVTPRDVANQALDSVGRAKVLGIVLNRVKFACPAWLLKRWMRA